jgi:hypothetical protein
MTCATHRILCHPVMRMLVLSAVLMCAHPAQADAPAFDRPGISFATSVLPPGSFDWEQGLPDLVRDSMDGVRSTTYTADTTLRLGLTSTLEIQLAGSLWNRIDLRAAGTLMRSEGAGDTKFALKWAPTLSGKDLALAVLGSVTVDTGSTAFTNGRPIVSLGATVTRDLGDGRSVAMYANVDRSGGVDTWTLSPNFSFPIKGNLGGYVEAGHVFGGGASSTVAGGGLTWLLHDCVQFDLYGLRGLTLRSPDVQAGFGISVFWK